MITDSEITQDALKEQQHGDLHHRARENQRRAAEQGFVPFNNVSRIASVLSQMLRHVRDNHRVNINLPDLVRRIPATEVSFDYSVHANVLVSTMFIPDWVNALGVICTDSSLKHVDQHVIYQEATQALVDGLHGDVDKALAFIGGIELAKEYSRGQP